MVNPFPTRSLRQLKAGVIRHSCLLLLSKLMQETTCAWLRPSATHPLHHSLLFFTFEVCPFYFYLVFILLNFRFYFNLNRAIEVFSAADKQETGIGFIVQSALQSPRQSTALGPVGEGRASIFPLASSRRGLERDAFLSRRETR